jgi:hypothetical protein
MVVRESDMEAGILSVAEHLEPTLDVQRREAMTEPILRGTQEFYFCNLFDF